MVTHRVEQTQQLQNKCSTVLYNREDDIVKLQDVYVRAFPQDEESGSKASDGKNSSSARKSSKHRKRRDHKQSSPTSTSTTTDTTASSSKSTSTGQQQKEKQRRRHLAILVSDAGTGKTTLVETALKVPVERSGGYFLTTNHNQYIQQSQVPPPLVPFCAIATQLLQRILQSNQQDELQLLRMAFQKTMDITELLTLATILPDLKHILPTSVTTQRQPQPYSSRQFFSIYSCNNFMVAFRSLMRAIASYNDRPIVLFFDGMHRLCSGQNNSTTTILQLIKSILIDINHIPNLFMIIAFQPVNYQHPLTTFIQELEQTNEAKQGLLEFCPIILHNLSQTNIYEWLLHTLLNNDNTKILASSMTEEEWYTISMHMIQNPVLTANGNPLAVKVMIQQILMEGSANNQNTYNSIMDVFEMILKKYIQDTEKCEKQCKSNGRRRLSNGQQDDIVSTTLLGHITTIFDSFSSNITKTLCQVAAISCHDITVFVDINVVCQVIIAEHDIDSLTFDLVVKEAIQYNILIPIDDENNIYCFSSCTYIDLIYSSIPTADRTIYHARIGEVLMKNNAMAESHGTGKSMFLISNHWCQGLEDLNLHQRQELAQLCLEAGDCSKRWSLHESACHYYAMALNILDSIASNGDNSDTSNSEKKWKYSLEMYDLSLELYLGVASACCYLGHLEDSQKYTNEIIDRVKHCSFRKKHSTKSTCDKSKAIIIEICRLVMQQHYEVAIDIGVKALQKLDVGNINNDIDCNAANKMVDNLAKEIINGSDSEGVFNSRMAAAGIVEKMHDLECEKTQLAMEILNLLLVPAFMIQRQKFFPIAYRIVKISSQSNSICPTSALGFVSMAAFFLSKGMIDKGILCQNIGKEIQALFHNKAFKGRMSVLENMLFVPHHGFSHQLKTAYRLCNDVGDNGFAMISTIVSVSNLFAAGGPLNLTGDAMKGVYQVLKGRNDKYLLFVLRPLFQMTLNLLGVEATKTSNENENRHHHHHEPHILEGCIIVHIEQEMEHTKDTNNTIAEFCIYLSQATLAFYMHKFDVCRETIEKCYDLPISDISLIASLYIQFCFIDAISCISMLWKESKEISKKKNKKDIAKMKKKYVGIVENRLTILELYAKSSPDLVEQKIYMIQGELQVVLYGQIDQAISLYKKAMNHCERYNILSDKAVACERAGLALRASHREDDALDYFEDCIGLYRQYGALAKVNHVKGNVIPGWDD